MFLAPQSQIRESNSEMKFHYPSLARFKCHNSGFCCESYAIPISSKEKEGLEKRPLVEKIPSFAGKSCAVPSPFPNFPHILGKEKSGRCHFLDDQNFCQLHSVFGAPSKPMACQIFPYTFVKAPDGIYTGVKFSCPSVAAAKGPYLKDNQKEIEALYKNHLKSSALPALEPEITIGAKKLPWFEVKAIEELLVQTLQRKSLPFFQRLNVMLELYSLLSHSLGGDSSKKRIEFWNILAEGTWKKAEKNTAFFPKKLKGSHRKLYYQMIYYFSQTIGQEIQLSSLQKSKRSLTSLFRGLKFMYGTGMFLLPLTQKKVSVRRVSKEIKHIAGKEGWDDFLENYFVTKIQSQTFFGPAFFHYTFEEGLNFLALLYPILCWYVHAYSLSEEESEPRLKDLYMALRCLDFTYSGSFLFEGILSRFRNRVIRTLKLPQLLIRSIPSPVSHTMG